MNEADQQSRELIRQLFEAQAQLDSLKRSVAYKLACRARRLFEFFVPPGDKSGGKSKGLHHSLRWAAGVWLDEGLWMLGARTKFKILRALRNRLRIGPELRGESEIKLAAARLYSGQPVSRDAEPITRLNLVYHVTPIIHPENIWQWNVDELLKRIHVFNGRRIITVATSTGADARAMDRPETVIQAFAGHDVEFRFAPNDPLLREAPHFLPALREVASTNSCEAVFYAHTKGVSHRDQVAVRAWTTAMYHHNLDRIDEVQRLLPRWPCVGIAKRHGHFEYLCLGLHRQEWTYHKRPWHGWHFSGTFWWVRHDKLFSRPDWDQIDMHAYAVEGYLANFFTSEEAIGLAFDEIDDPYDPLAWSKAA